MVYIANKKLNSWIVGMTDCVSTWNVDAHTVVNIYTVLLCCVFWCFNMFREDPYDTHWNENAVILTKFSSLAALKVVILTTFSAASDENFIKMKTFPFQCTYHLGLLHWHCTSEVALMNMGKIYNTIARLQLEANMRSHSLAKPLVFTNFTQLNQLDSNNL